MKNRKVKSIMLEINFQIPQPSLANEAEAVDAEAHLIHADPPHKARTNPRNCMMQSEAGWTCRSTCIYSLLVGRLRRSRCTMTALQKSQVRCRADVKSDNLIRHALWLVPKAFTSLSLSLHKRRHEIIVLLAISL